ncbi:MAG: heme ABC transporter ATP-binding protein [Phyllobacteriaceae bacterium]|nr:heme ABC transporter ATP-binding protein [Phyllobacteriaceae bacterium]MBA90318.1 heme ABC transporter ATP-binding protein [Phyllobacteriaceae bacterium]
MFFQARQLHVRYGRREILHGIGFEAKAGEVTVIAGPNGSGKTTLMRALCGDVEMTGDVVLNGRALDRYAPGALARTRAVLAQETALAFPFTVAEVVGLGMASISGTMPDAAARAGRIAEALARVDLDGFSGRFCQELSGGERQRVQLARVLCQIWEPMTAEGPRWLLLDEPVSSLDIRHQLTIMDIARDFARRGGGVIAVMHDLNLTAMYADHVTFLANGHVAASGTPAETMTDGLLADVYGCRLRVGQVPDRVQFVLPQTAVG